MIDRRTGCEGSNSLKHVIYQLGERLRCSAIHFLVRLSRISLLEHVQGGRAQDRARLRDNPEIQALAATTT